MALKRRIIVALTTVMSIVLFFVGATNVQAARADMVDVSNNNGAMTVSNFTDMHNNYGIKAIVTKVSEGTSFKDSTAAGNIAAAKSAGLYVNGYHYARYSTVSGAKDEADYAAKIAQADGLPSGAVLATDVESSEQQNLSTAQNDANNAAFMSEVAKYGYRSCIYTMGSWVGTTMTVNQGWIAAYPYNATGVEEYTTQHAWQWSSSYTFNGSYGNFDVSELYDSYFASYTSPTGSSSTTTTTTTDNSSSSSSASTDSGSNSAGASADVITVKNSSSSYVPLMALQSDGTMKRITNEVLGNNTPWKTDQTKSVNGVTYYRVATNEWVAASYVTGNSSSSATTNNSSSNSSSSSNVIKVKNPSGSYVKLQALQSDGTMKDITNEVLGNNTPWKTDQTKVVNGVTYYRVATNEWVSSAYVVA